jgi:hypothetical protein
MIRKLKKEMIRKQAAQKKEKHKPEITAAAQRIKREEPIEDILLKRKVEHDAKMEEKRKEMIQQEVSI